MAKDKNIRRFICKHVFENHNLKLINILKVLVEEVAMVSGL